MPAQLFLEERRRWILDELKKHGRVSVAELSTQMNVSAVTIRQDLKSLEGEGLLNRTHGGAVEIQTKTVQEERELSFDVRRSKQIEEKDAIGRAAARIVQTGSAIALDASTTVCSIVPHLAHLDALTIVTNNLMIPELVLNRPQMEVVLSGGKLRRDSYSVTGNPNSLPNINLNIGFVSAWGISPDAGLTEVNEGEMKMKQALLARCMYIVLVVDSSKWGRVAPYTYARPEDFDMIITTNQVSQDMLDLFPSLKIEVVHI